LNSDHGYPDPQKNLKKSIPLLGHDLVMTEDNITTPLIIIGKKFKSHNKVYERVGLIDISDLIKSIISNKINSNKLYQLNLGKSHNHSIYSTWNRYIAQPNGKVCLVKNNIKLIYDLDTQEKLFYEIKSKEVNNDWVVEEIKLKSNDIKKYYDAVRILEEDLKFRFRNIEDFFSNKLKNKILKEWRIRGLNKIILIGKFTPIYKKIIENIVIDDLRFFCFEINNLSREQKDFFKNNISRDYKCIYVASGTSISRWLREIIFFNIRFNQLLFFSDFDLNRPESILIIYRYIPKLIYQLFKSFKAWGFKNTIRIILKKI